MRRSIPLLSVATFLSIVIQAAPGDAKKDAQALQGAWMLTELIVGGKPAPENQIKGLQFIFKADKLTIVPPPPDVSAIPPKVLVILGIGLGAQVPPPRVVDERSFSVKLDSTKDPKHVDLTALDGDNKGVVSPGIFEIKDGTLRWCQSDDPKNMERPKTLASPANSQYYLFTFKRAK